MWCVFEGAASPEWQAAYVRIRDARERCSQRENTIGQEKKTFCLELGLKLREDHDSLVPDPQQFDDLAYACSGAIFTHGIQQYVSTYTVLDCAPEGVDTVQVVFNRQGEMLHYCSHRVQVVEAHLT